MTMYVSDYCVLCGHTSDDPKEFIIIEETTDQAICNDVDACARRQKRDAILAEMQEMASKKTHVHPVDKFSFGAISICAGALLGTIITCLLFLFGF